MSLPSEVTSKKFLRTFRTKLKTHLFILCRSVSNRRDSEHAAVIGGHSVAGL